MKTLNIALLSLAVAAGLTAANDASAYRGGHHHHGGARFGVFVGAPLFPYYYSPYWYPRYYYPPAYVAPAAPPVYIEQGGAPAAAVPSAPTTGQSGYWYYCQDTQTYYPYVQQCASPWQQVQPQASAAPQ
jgi:hypothetical protein